MAMSIAIEGRKNCTGRMAGYFSTSALIIETQPGCVVNSLYLGIIKPAWPVICFTYIKKAVEGLWNLLNQGME